MRFVFYTHSLLSDWNHGNAHFLRGVLRDLIARGHQAIALEPEDSWSRENLFADKGPAAIERFRRDFPELISRQYGNGFDHEAALNGSDAVIVHEWTEPALIARIGRIRRDGADFTLIFHDTHHRAVSEESAIAEMMLRDYDAVLAFGEALRQRYLDKGWGKEVHTWHEAADIRLFKPLHNVEKTGDLIWIGNWGDDERTAELAEFLIGPAADLGLRTIVHGVRYPNEAKVRLANAGIGYEGWIANADVPTAFARNRMTVHVPRRPYVKALPGIPTIRVFEALACGIPLISAPWSDVENLFRPGDFLYAHDGEEMRAHMRMLLNEPQTATELARCGLETVRNRHTCAHRVDQLLTTLSEIGTPRVLEALEHREAAQ